MVFEQIIEYELKGPEPLGQLCSPKTCYFRAKKKFPRQTFE